MPSDDVLISRDDAIVTLTFNRPQARNALTWEMYERLHQACDEVDADADVRVLVLRGAGGQAFASGTEISQFLTFATAEDGIAYERKLERVVARLERVSRPVIGQIEGYAVGGGFSIAAACDLRVATPGARFGVPIARTLGNCLSMEAYARFVDLFGPSRLKRLLLTAELLPADEALAAGFVHEVVEPAAIDTRVRALAREIAGFAPITLRVSKEAIRRVQEHRRVTGGEDLIGLTYASADFKEGVQAFVDKRPPRWTGT